MGDAFLYSYLPSRHGELGLSMAAVGLILSVNRFSRMFLNNGLALMVGKYGLRTSVLSGSLLALFSTYYYGAAPSLFIWIVLRVLWGISFSVLRLSGIIYAVNHPRRGISLGLSKSIVEAGSVLALLVGPLLLIKYGAHMTFLFLSVAGLAGFIIAWFLPDISFQQVGRVPLRLSMPDSYNTVVLTSAFAVEGMLVVLTGSLLHRQGNVSPTEVLLYTGLALAYRRAAIIVFSPLAGLLADRKGFAAVFDGTALFTALGIIMIAAGFAVPGLALSFTAAALNASVSPGGAVQTGNSVLKDISANANWRDIGAASGTFLGALFINSSYLQLLFLAASMAVAGSLLYHFKTTRYKLLSNGISRSL
jgi:MFS transporter, DHA1 family, multidrug resistance protein